jgi:transcriptional regulator with XRE-family HTH domain
VVTDIDVHIGKRLRRRRRSLGLTQHDLGDKIGVRFQQVQKYECGANRITAGRLFALSKALSVSVAYFYDGLASNGTVPANDPGDRMDDVLGQKETIELVRAYYRLGERPRQRLLALAKSLEDELPEFSGGVRRTDSAR